jgi:uncharacterized protein (DUF924 family)
VSLCYHAIKKGFDQEIIQKSGAKQIAFFYMPLMHSEKLEDQNNAVKYFKATGIETNLRFALHSIIGKSLEMRVDFHIAMRF